MYSHKKYHIGNYISTNATTIVDNNVESEYKIDPVSEANKIRHETNERLKCADMKVLLFINLLVIKYLNSH